MISDELKIRVTEQGADDVGRKFGGVNQQLEKIGKTGKKAGDMMGGLEGAVGKLAAAFAGLQVINKVKDVLDFDTELGQLQADMELNNTEAKKLKDNMLNLASAYGTTKEEVLGGYQTFQSFAGEIEKYEGTMGRLVMTHKATGASLSDLAKLQSVLVNTLGLTPETSMDAIGSLRAFANAGTIELRQMSEELPNIMTRASALGFVGERGIKQVGTLLAVAGEAYSGNAAEAKTAINALFRDLEANAPKIKKLLKFSIFNKDGSMKDLDKIMGMFAEKTKYGTKRGKGSLLDFFTADSSAVAQKWTGMLGRDPARLKKIKTEGESGSFADIQDAYTRRMQGISSEAEKLKKSMASLDENVNKLIKTIMGFAGENPKTAVAAAAGLYAAPKIAAGAVAAGAAIKAGAAAGAAAGGIATRAGLAAAITAVGGGIILPVVAATLSGVGSGIMLDRKFGWSDKLSDSMVSGQRRRSKDAMSGYEREVNLANAKSMAIQMAKLNHSGVKNFIGPYNISRLAAEKMGLPTNKSTIDEIRKAIIDSIRFDVVVKPAGGIDKAEASVRRANQ